MTTILFKKTRIIIGIPAVLIMLVPGVLFISHPERFLRHVFSKPDTIVLIGICSVLFCLILLYSLLTRLKKKYAIIISNKYLVDHSTYGSIGKINYSEIISINKLKKYSIELKLNPLILENINDHIIKKTLRFMTNWNYKKSIIISTAILDCNQDELYTQLRKAFKHYKNLQ